MFSKLGILSYVRLKFHKFTNKLANNKAESKAKLLLKSDQTFVRANSVLIFIWFVHFSTKNSLACFIYQYMWKLFKIGTFMPRAVFLPGKFVFLN